MTKFGEVKLVDFGLAKASSHLVEENEDMVKGKFGYLAPEVTLGQGSDHRVDIFATGILLWEMLAGRRLFRGETDVDTFKLVRATVVPDIQTIRAEVGDALAKVVIRALARDPKDRYATADEFARDLSLVLIAADRPITYLDLGKLVREAAADRARKRKAEGKENPGVIGDLILDAIHQFSGGIDTMPESEGPRLGTRGVKSATQDFVDPAAWGLDALFDEPAPPNPATPPVARPATPGPTAPAPPPVAPAAAVVPPLAARPMAPPTAAAAPPTPQAAAEKPRPAATAIATKKEGTFWKKWFG